MSNKHNRPNDKFAPASEVAARSAPPADVEKALEEDAANPTPPDPATETASAVAATSAPPADVEEALRQDELDHAGENEHPVTAEDPIISPAREPQIAFLSPEDRAARDAPAPAPVPFAPITPPPAPAEPVVVERKLREPVLDRSKPMGDIYGADGPNQKNPRFAQNGHYFAGDGTYLTSEASAPRTFEDEPVERQVEVDTNLDEDEIDELMKTAEAEDLLPMDRSEIVRLVNEAGGPVVSGDGSQRYMVAWLLKHVILK